jgi:hypothetical protein
MLQKRLFLSSCFLLLAAGCAPQTRYAWNEYDTILYQYYKSPAEDEQFVEHLKEVIDKAEAVGKVPPGIYAEYGFALYEKGNFQEAAKYFKLEKDKWPESNLLMAKMIQNTQQLGNRNKQANVSVAPVDLGAANTAMTDVKGKAK